MRYVGDNPPATLLNRLARIYLDNKTAIGPVLTALFASAEFAASPGKKVGRGQELIGSMMRARKPSTFVAQIFLDDGTSTDDTQHNPWGSMGAHTWMLDVLGHSPRLWPYVDGYPDKATDWTSTNHLRALWNMTEAVVGN